MRTAVAKLAGANILIVLGARRRRHRTARQLRAMSCRFFGIVRGESRRQSRARVRRARPLSDLERTATQPGRGDMEARCRQHSPIETWRVGTMLNALLDRLTEDRARERRLPQVSAQDEELPRVARSPRLYGADPHRRDAAASARPHMRHLPSSMHASRVARASRPRRWKRCVALAHPRTRAY